MNRNGQEPPVAHLPDSLISGYRSFKAGRFAEQSSRYRALAEKGQQPDCLVIACCDSRAIPETIFDAAPGEIFVVRNVANMVPPYRPDGELHGTSAALEFAVQALKVRHILVMGHGRCGGINAALNPGDEPLSPGDFIGSWMDMLKPAIADMDGDETTGADDPNTKLERVSVKRSIENLRTFPCIKILEDKGRLSLHGAWFDIAEGELWVLDPATGRFEMVPA